MKDDVDKMKHKIKLFLIPFMLLATLFFVTACSQDPTAYDNNDANGYTVSVKYDANGGVFTGTSSIMVDSFNIFHSRLPTPTNKKGVLQVQDALTIKSA